MSKFFNSVFNGNIFEIPLNFKPNKNDPESIDELVKRMNAIGVGRSTVFSQNVTGEEYVELAASIPHKKFKDFEDTFKYYEESHKRLIAWMWHAYLEYLDMIQSKPTTIYWRIKPELSLTIEPRYQIYMRYCLSTESIKPKIYIKQLWYDLLHWIKR